MLCHTKALDVFDRLKRVWSAMGLFDKRNPQVVEHRDYWAVYEDASDSQWAVIVRKDWKKEEEKDESTATAELTRATEVPL